jgi:hypothetical protein
VDSLESATEALLLSSEGLALGLHPTYTRGGDQDQLRTRLYGQFGWKLNALRDSTETVYLHQGRLGAGFELELRPNPDARTPLTISLNPALTFFDRDRFKRVTNEDRSSFLSLTSTGIIPISDGFGLLAEGIAAEGSKPVWRFGIILAPTGDDDDS